MVLKAYRYRIYPSEDQKHFFDHHFGCCRFVYNHFLNLRIEKWKSEKINLSGFDCKKMLPDLKVHYPWLKGVNSQSLQASVLNLEMAVNRFFKGLGRHPRFHKKHSRQTFLVPQHFKITYKGIAIPKLKALIRVNMHRPLGGKPKNLTIIMESSGKYYVSVVCECEIWQLRPVENTVGVDLNLRSYAVLSNNERVDHPKWGKNSEHKLERLQRSLSRKINGSQNSNKARLKVARLHEKIRSQRSDFLHKLSRKLVNENQVISLEGLRVRNMVKNRHLAKSISDSGWSEFARMVKYKADWYGRTVKVIGTFYPSSKECCICHHINKDLKLSQRVWVCPHCKTVHDRDHNAAVNIDRVGQGMPELTPAERMASVLSALPMRQVASKKQEAMVPN